MKRSIKVDQKKKRGRPATGRDPMVSARIPAATIGAIDEWARRNETTRSGAIALLVELGLSVKTKSAPSERQRAALADLASKAIDSWQWRKGKPEASLDQGTGRVSGSASWSSREEMILMDGKVFSSEGRYVADIRADGIYDLAGKRLYNLRGQKIYKPTGELVGHLNSGGGDRRLDKSTDRLFPKV
jgi:hypothetical protein